MGKSGEKWITIGDNQMFIGEYQHNIDEKGRIALPSKFRSDLKDGAIVTRGLDNCLFVYTKKEWASLLPKLGSLSFTQARSRAFNRFILASAMNLELDGQGRILLPEYLRQFASLKKEAVIAGLYNRLEIWDKAEWEKYKQATEKDSVKIAEELGGLGI